MKQTLAIVCVALCVLLGPLRFAGAQPAPVVDVELAEPGTIPGQFLTLRITVLVPTWMPEPVVFPTLDTPNVRVRLPERSTSPTSRRIDGADWSGVTRRYQVSPMAAGRFVLPQAGLEVTYADPDNTARRLKTTVALPELVVEGRVPEGAEDLSPFLAATGLTLAQDLSGATSGLTPGSSLKRTVTATISGTSPMMLPPLMTPPDIEGFAVYADEPVLEETENRGLLAGTRRESLTLMAEGSGSGELPAIEVRWYNLKTGTVETAALDPVPVSAKAPPATTTGLPWGLDARTWLMAGLGLAALGLFLWRVAPAARRTLGFWQQRRRAGKAHARKAVLGAIAARDYPATVAAMQVWAARAPETPQDDQQAIREALRPLSARRYGGASDADATRDWQTLERTVRRVSGHRRRVSRSGHLPALNP